MQRIGKAREEAAASRRGGRLGAKAAPQPATSTGTAATRTIGSWLRRREEMARHWKGGKVVALPLPPPGFQWELGAAPGHEEEAEKAVKLSAVLDEDSGKWTFGIGGVAVEAFDARPVIVPCSLDLTNHTPKALAKGSERRRLLCTALYVQAEQDGDRNGNGGAEGDRIDESAAMEDGPSIVAGEAPPRPPHGDAVLQTLERLHALAVEARYEGVSEGLVYDWLPLASAGGVHARTWRDALLTIKTRDAEHVVLGPVQSDGNGTSHDMSEGVLLRLFHGLECLYPTALIKEAALRWRVRPRGAGYHHLLVCLEQPDAVR